ncbi:MAG TPA: polysaccharide deacetylase family protein [Anaerolineales bacterium]|nr:polysaccharide deacetylase family protein [Anaerolineales bacterium]
MKHIAILFLFLHLFCSSCPPVVQVATVPAMRESTRTPTSLPKLTFTPTSLSVITLTPTFTLTIAPTLDPIRRTPPTLMLHRPSLQFDSLAFLKEFIKILQQNNMSVVTYRDISVNPDLTATESGKLFVITIDDISLAYPMNRQVIEMTEVLREAGYPAVLGVVTETDYPFPETVTLLKELSESGWEIASHTDHHANLGKLEKASANLVYQEVTTSLDKIEKAIGIRPITLVLPEGQMVDYMETLDHMHLQWVVGINGGVRYDSRDKITYVGREGPSKNAEYTYKIMKMRFGF